MPQAGARPIAATNLCSLDTQIRASGSSRSSPGSVVLPEFCSTKALMMPTTENSRGKQKECFLSVFHDWEFNFSAEKKWSRFILLLCLKKKKSVFFLKLSLQWVTRNSSALFDFFFSCIFYSNFICVKRHRNCEAGSAPVQCCSQHQIPQENLHKHPLESWGDATFISHQTWLKSPSLKSYILLKFLTF